jgi:predicted MPP superfamily phosphohydrolase
MAMDSKPNLIILGGDYVDFRHPSIIANVATLARTLNDAACPVVAVMGNHDYWSTVPRKVVEAFDGTKVKMLLNETIEIDGVTIAGLDDAIQGQQRYDFFPKGQVSRSLLAILHEPDFVKDMPVHVSLQLSGHSHGGQVCLPFGKSLYTPFGARRYVAGFYRNARAPLYVSKGVGTTGPDYRLFCPPEVSVITLRSA